RQMGRSRGMPKGAGRYSGHAVARHLGGPGPHGSSGAHPGGSGEGPGRPPGGDRGQGRPDPRAADGRRLLRGPQGGRMIPILSPAESAALDAESEARGVTTETLMENAGRAVAQEAAAIAGGRYGRRAVVVCGKGNNGGDGL